jgi:hypothetical protein
VESDPAEKPEHSEHNQHGSKRPMNTKAHASEKEKDDDYNEK